MVLMDGTTSLVMSGNLHAYHTVAMIIGFLQEPFIGLA